MRRDHGVSLKEKSEWPQKSTKGAKSEIHKTSDRRHMIIPQGGKHEDSNSPFLSLLRLFAAIHSGF
jgi:hypothetical protein